MDLPVLQCVLGSPDYLAHESVYFVVKSGDELGGGADLVLGQGRISLSSLLEFFPTSDVPTFQPPVHISTLPPSALKHVMTANPFPPTLADGQDGSIGLGATVRAPSKPGIWKSPSKGETHNSWTFSGLVERHSAATGTLNGHIFISIEHSHETGEKKSEEQLIQEVLSAE